MGWAKFDDQFTDHPKVVAAGPMAELLAMRAVIHCARYETDGFVQAAQLPKLAIQIKSPKKQVEALVAVGLWEEADGGWWVHDFLDYHPSAEQKEQERAQARERMSKVRKKKKGTSDDVRPNTDRSSDYPDPTPPLEETEPNGSGGKPPKTVEVPEFTNPLPVGPGNGEPLYALLRTWAVDAGFVRPEDRKAAVQWQWLMTVVDEVLGDGKHSHGVRVTLCGEFAAHVTGEPLERPGWQHLRQLVSSHGGALTLAALGQACDWGAGLRPQDQGDPLSLTKYAAAILQRWAEAA